MTDEERVAAYRDLVIRLAYATEPEMKLIEAGVSEEEWSNIIAKMAIALAAVVTGIAFTAAPTHEDAPSLAAQILDIIDAETEKFVSHFDAEEQQTRH